MVKNKLNIKTLDLKKANKTSAKQFPRENGVYIFLDEDKNILYIGKSKNLKNRINSYFHTKLFGKTKIMVSKAKFLAYIPVASEIESLILEAKLIREEKPQYNLELKDDKHPLYIRITNEEYPRILTARKIDSNKNNIKIYGPFPSSANVKSVLRIIRKIFPFSTHKPGKGGCVHAQIGLCQPCPNIFVDLSADEKKLKQAEYKLNIKYIMKFLDGKFKSISYSLKKDLVNHSKNEDYENALEIKKKLDQIEYITQPIFRSDEYIKNPNFLKDIRDNEVNELYEILTEYFKDLRSLKRIECFDVAHIQGTSPAASMVTFVDGEPDKSLYRKFRIAQKKGNSDTDSLYEVALRRKKHFVDWGRSDLIIVDGGKGQVSSFVKVFADSQPVVGIAKREETLIIPVFEKNKLSKYRQKKLRGNSLHLIQRLRNEAHRFSRSYHHKLVEKELRSIELN